MKLPSHAAKVLLELDREQTRNLVESFVLFATGQGWGFSYTDDIGAQCKKLYSSLDDPCIRAQLIRCVMEVGAGHNRWYVMGIFDELMEEKHSQAEILAISEVFGQLTPFLKNWVTERMSASKLHPTIAAALVSNLEDGSI
jgi:eukaryotic-like serine/threonine-protein kinase